MFRLGRLGDEIYVSVPLKRAELEKFLQALDWVVADFRRAETLHTLSPALSPLILQ